MKREAAEAKLQTVSSRYEGGRMIRSSAAANNLGPQVLD